MILTKPWLWLPPTWSHNIAVRALKYFGPVLPARNIQWQPLVWRGLSFPSRLGIAGGVDKNAENVEAYWRFGAGFVEVGTVTPNAQGPNAGVILKRSVAKQALWNRMGFPNVGMQTVRKNLVQLPSPRRTPVFVNIGKNRSTDIADAANDYTHAMDFLADVADAFVVNISSPNTANLRDLLKPEKLAPLLIEIAKHKHQKPLLLKISPDISLEDLKNILDISVENGVDGWILTNTTTARESGSPFPAEGGVSGLPLKKRSIEVLQQTIQHLGARKQGRLVVSVGGVMNAQDAHERVHLGADLVAVYSTLVLNGVSIFSEVAKA